MKEVEYTNIEEIVSNICDLENNVVVIVLDTSKAKTEDCPKETVLTFSFIDAKSEIVKDVIRGIATKVPIINITVKGFSAATDIKYKIKQIVDEEVQEKSETDETMDATEE